MNGIDLRLVPQGKGVVIDKSDARTLLLYFVDGKPWVYYVDSILSFDNDSLVGNIYKGKVINSYVSGTRFVDAGINQDLMLSSNKYSDGEYILVQVVNDEHDQKTYKATTSITLNSMYLVFCPTEPLEINYSQKLSSAKKALFKKHENLLVDMLKQNVGGGRVIIRTIANKFDIQDICKELGELIEKWNYIKKTFSTNTNVGLIIKGDSKEDVFKREYLADSNFVITNDPQTVELAKKIKISNIEFVQNEELLDISHLIDNEYVNCASRIVNLDDGKINLRFDYTEACTFIDVNAGAYHSSKKKEDFVLDINLKAAKEIARQISLRNIGGAIVVDFITMQQESSKKALIDFLKAETSKDRQKVKVFSTVTNLGMVEMVRARGFKRLDQDLHLTCTHCGGNGFVFSSKIFILKLMSDIKAQMGSLNCGKVQKKLIVYLRASFATFVTEDVRSYICNLFPKDIITFDTLPDEAIPNKNPYSFKWDF